MRLALTLRVRRARVGPVAAVITGAGRGIGRAIALDLARAGHPVALQSRTASAVEAVAGQIRQAGGQAVAVPGDVTDEASAEGLIAACTAAFGEVSVAVAGAGQALSAPIKRTTADDLRRLFEVNTVSAFHLIKHASAVMQPGGRIIVIASIASVKGMQYTGAYCASKHAVLGLVKSAAMELAKKRITVNAICPGWVDTPMFDQTLENISRKTGCSLDEARDQLEAMVPIGKVLDASEVAAMVRYVVSDAAAKLTGQALVIDGGETL